MLVVAPEPAGATVFTVTDAGDTGPNTLREAFTLATLDASGPHTIDIQVASPIILTSGRVSYANPAFPLTINGNGATVQQDSTPAMSTQAIFNGSAQQLTVNDLPITGGDPTTGGGGAVKSVGPVTLNNSTITGNSGPTGGGISSDSAVTITNSTVSGNTATSGSGGGVESPTSITATHTTFTGNSATAGGAAIGTIGTATLKNSTVSGNTGMGTAGAISAGAGVTLVYSTVVSNTSGTAANITAGPMTTFGSVVALKQGGGTNCVGGAVTSHGWNFSDDTSCGFTNAGSGDRQVAQNPGLGPLASNGGPTQTHMPARPGPLPDAIPAASCQADGASGITTDQRGVGRPQGPGCDIGSVEAPPPPPVCPATAEASLGAGSLAGAEGVVAVAPVGLAAPFRRRRRGAWASPPAASRPEPW